MMQKQIDKVADVAIEAVDEFLDSYLEAYSTLNDDEYDYGVTHCALDLKNKLPKIVRKSTDKINFSPLTVAADSDELLIVCLYEEVLDKLSEYYGTDVYDCQDEYLALIELLGILTEAQDSKVRKNYFFGCLERESIFHGMGSLRHFADDCYDILKEHMHEYGEFW